MRKGVVLASFMLVACGPSSCHLFGPSAEEVAKQKAEARAQADHQAIQACQTRNEATAQANAADIAQNQTLIKTTLDKVSEGQGTGDNQRSLDWSVEIAALDPDNWRWTETNTITSQHTGFLGSTSTQQAASTITYTLIPAELQESLTVIPHDDGTAGLRLYCKFARCIHALGTTKADTSSTLPFSGNKSHADTVLRDANSTDWLLSTRTRAEGLKAAVEKLLALQAYKAPACTNSDGTPSMAAPPEPSSAE